MDSETDKTLRELKDMDEVWSLVPGTFYAASNTGKIASMKKGWRILKPVVDRLGYQRVWLYGDINKNIYVHRIVAERFISPAPSPKHQVNHKDGNSGNNADYNLEWVTPTENSRHRFDVLGHGNAVGEKCYQSKLKETDVLDIRRRVLSGEAYESVANDYEITLQNVSHIHHRRSWASLK